MNLNYWNNKTIFTVTNTSEFGVHGYDNNESDMHPFFMARGPKIRKMHKVAPFYTVDLFNLFTEILEIPSRPNNGSAGNTINILVEHFRYSVGTLIIITGKLLLACSVLLCLLRWLKLNYNLVTAFLLNKQDVITIGNYLDVIIVAFNDAWI